MLKKPQIHAYRRMNIEEAAQYKQEVKHALRV